MSDLESKQNPAPREDEDWCFGMISNIPILGYKPDWKSVDSLIIPLHLFEPNVLREPEQTVQFGQIDERTGRILCTLQSQENVSLQLCSKTTSDRAITGSKRKRKPELVASLNVMIYGPPALYDSVGDYLSKCDMYLQDPLYCDRNVLYKNPQLLSDGQECVMTFDFIPSSTTVVVERVHSHPDIFELLGNAEELPETEGPPQLATSLYSHQKQALTFMLKREHGFSYDASDEFWVKTINNDVVQFKNTITETTQADHPLEYRGGLLADHMGLGKTLTMIALIVSNQMTGPAPPILLETGVLRSIKSTLIVVPNSLMQTWENQLQRHLLPQTLVWTTFHRSKKRKIASIGQCHVVITTYETLVSQQKRCKDPKSAGETLFSYNWHRIVLDEAHTIRNRTTSRAQAAFSVYATHRWAISGTPIQNKLGDFASLLEFLRVQPFSDPKVFETEIAKPWMRSTEQDQARMRKLVNCTSLCRTKTVVDLPSREDLKHTLDFSDSERNLYESAKNRTRRQLDDALATSPMQSRKYVNALQWLNQLRLICNHGHMQASKVDVVAQIPEQSVSWDKETAQLAFNSLVASGAAFCSLCAEEITESTLDTSGADDTKLHRPLISACLTLICVSCILDKVGEATCCSNPHCKGVEVAWTETKAARPATGKKQLPKMGKETVPTKLKTLLASLKDRGGEEKSVVFSYWTYTLDLVESLLQDEAMSYTRIDGQLSSEKRGEAIQVFQTDDSIRVILVSITCGGAGLDLTAASCAYLLEPQWNPMMEEQALCRIHRLGQKKAVKTIRYLMRNTFEEKVVLTQEMKRNLAESSFSSEDKLGPGSQRLQYLRSTLE